MYERHAALGARVTLCFNPSPRHGREGKNRRVTLCQKIIKNYSLSGYETKICRAFPLTLNVGA